jgi:hypothetical protein
MPLGRREGKRLIDDHRAIGEVPIGRYQCDFGSIACQISQGEQRLEAGDTAAENQDVARLWGRDVP